MSKTAIQTKTCQWCGGPLSAKACAACNAVAPKNNLEVPGLTSMPAELMALQSRFDQHFALLRGGRIIKFLEAIDPALA